ncbi:uncharacterized protein LOC116178897 [Photinus pyralis]|uniref:uncharacterized protein LOC116178897 n=1 Tax=Photinus pyralis TaxID=7054 RepID=UPI001267280E|nr:uncharacterized protein LOC116178897 [Photinus pyralis]
MEKHNAYDVDTWITVMLVYFSILSACSILLVIGSFKCKPMLIFPFLTAYPIYVVLWLTTHVRVMVGLKNQDIGIGNLILYSNLGGFLILLLLYMWFCVFCFVQMVYELKSEMKKEKNVGNSKNNNEPKKIARADNYYKIYLP